jgi:hypothetical protein
LLPPEPKRSAASGRTRDGSSRSSANSARRGSTVGQRRKPSSGSSRPPQLAMPACWAGWAGSGPSPWPASKGRTVTAPGWLAMSAQRASGSSRWIA